MDKTKADNNYSYITRRIGATTFKVKVAVNFRYHKLSYKDKHTVKNPEENWLIFENTHEAIVDKETWELAQKLRKTPRRIDTFGEANPLTGLVFCADCGEKMYNHRSRGGKENNPYPMDFFDCSTYQWYGSNLDDNTTTGTPIDGATEKKFNPNEYKQYKYYYCVVTSTDAGYDPIEIRTGVVKNKSYVTSQEPEKEPADYTVLDEVLSNIPKDLSVYTEESVANLKAVEESIDRNLDIANQEQVNKWADELTEAIENLVIKLADYSAVEVAKSKADEIDRDLYTPESLAKLDEAIAAIDYNLTIDKQSQVEEIAKAIEKAISELEYKSADYSAVVKALAQVPSDLTIYTEESVLELQEVIGNINYTLNITQQEQVDECAEKVDEAIRNLKKECCFIRFLKRLVAFFNQILIKIKLVFN